MNRRTFLKFGALFVLVSSLPQIPEVACPYHRRLYVYTESGRVFYCDNQGAVTCVGSVARFSTGKSPVEMVVTGLSLEENGEVISRREVNPPICMRAGDTLSVEWSLSVLEEVTP